jgi:hypothetical protein
MSVEYMYFSCMILGRLGRAQKQGLDHVDII